MIESTFLTALSKRFTMNPIPKRPPWLAQLIEAAHDEFFYTHLRTLNEHLDRVYPCWLRQELARRKA